MDEAIQGAILLGYWAIGLCFSAFQRRHRERLFGYFAFAFWLLAAERLLLIVIDTQNEFSPYIYLVRLVAFLSILMGIYDKNRDAS